MQVVSEEPQAKDALHRSWASQGSRKGPSTVCREETEAGKSRSASAGI